MFKRNVIKSKAMMGVGFKSEGTSTASLDHCLYRVKRTAADLRLVQSQLGAYLQHARAKGSAGRGVTASLGAFFAHAQADADAPEVPRERDTHAAPEFNKARDEAQSRRREAASLGCKSPDLKTMEAAFKASSAGPPLAGVLEHIHEGVQVTVLAPIGRLVDELTVAEQRLLHVKNGALKKEHDYYSSKVKALTEGATKAETKAAELKRLAEERASAARAAAAEAAAAEAAAERQNAGGPSWLSEGKDSSKDKASLSRRPTPTSMLPVDPSKDPKVEKQRKLAAEEAERVARNQAKSEEAARFYFSALHSAMDHAETLMACAPGHVARAVAQFRGHKELAAAAEHALAVEDFEATAPEEVHWEQAEFVRQLDAAERGEALEAEAAPPARGGDEGGESPEDRDQKKKAQCHADLRAEVVLSLRNRVKREVKGIEGLVRKKGWLGSSQHRFVVLRGNCLELYHDKSRYDTGRPPEDALRVTLVEPAGETKPHYVAPPPAASAAASTGGSASSSSSQDEPARRKSETMQEPLSATSEYGFFNSELGDLLVSTSFDGAGSGTSGGAPNSSSNGIGLASFKITATSEVPAFWTAEEVVTHMRAESVPSVSGLNSSSTGGNIGGEGEPHSGGAAAGSSSSEGLSGDRSDDVSKSASALLGEGDEHKLQLQFEARSERKLKEWGEALNACCAWDHGVVSIVSLLKALDRATAYRDQTATHHHVRVAHGGHKAAFAGASGTAGAHSHAHSSLGHPAFVGAGALSSRSASASRAGSQSRSADGSALSSEAAKKGAISSKKNPFAKNPFAAAAATPFATTIAAEASATLTDEANATDNASASTEDASAASDSPTSEDSQAALPSAEELPPAAEAPSEDRLQELDNVAANSVDEEVPATEPTAVDSKDDELEPVAAASVDAPDVNASSAAGVGAGNGDESVSSSEVGAEGPGQGADQEPGDESNRVDPDQDTIEERNVNDQVNDKTEVDDQNPMGSSSEVSGEDEVNEVADSEEARSSPGDNSEKDTTDVMKAGTLAHLAAEKEAKHSAEIQQETMDKAFDEAENIAAKDEERTAAVAAAAEGIDDDDEENEAGSSGGGEDAQMSSEGLNGDASANSDAADVSTTNQDQTENSTDATTLEGDNSVSAAAAAAVVESPVDDVPSDAAVGNTAEGGEASQKEGAVASESVAPESNASDETLTPPSGEALSGTTDEGEVVESGKKDTPIMDDDESEKQGEAQDAEVDAKSEDENGTNEAGALSVDGATGDTEVSPKDEGELSCGAGE